METEILSTTVGNKVYKESSIQIGAFLGGPLVAGYLVAANYKQLGEEEKVKKTWLWTIVGFMAFVIAAFLVPDSVPGIVFNAVNVGVVTLIVQKFQSAQIKAHMEAGGALYKTRRAALIGLCCGLVFIALFLGMYFLADMYLQQG